MRRWLGILFVLSALAICGCKAVCEALRGTAASGPNSDQSHGADPTPQPKPSYY